MTTNNSPLSTNNHQETTVTPTIIVEQCSSCNSTKRKPPLSHFLENQENDQHLSKKPNLSQLSTQFTNIHISSPDTLRRTLSAPVTPPVQPFFNPFTPENDAKKAQAALLQRCASDPTPVLGFPVTSPESSKIGNETPKTKTAASLPPRWNAMIRRRRRRIEAERMRRKRGDAATSQDKVKKMKEIIGVTSQWMSRIAQEDEEKQEQEQEDSQDTHVAQIPKGKENVGETEEEAVSVEKTGECLVIQFKCNCSKTYQILLYGDACYYKLI